MIFGAHRLLFIAVVLLAAFNPVRAVPAFAAQTADCKPIHRGLLALRDVAIAAAAAGAVVLAGFGLARLWQLSWGAASMAAGLVLLLGALHSLYGAREPSPAPATGPAARSNRPPPMQLITPYGVAFLLLLSTTIKKPDLGFQLTVLSALGGVLALNLIALAAAPAVVRWAGAATLKTVGWTLAVVLAALAVQAIASPVQELVLQMQPDDDGGDAAYDQMDRPSPS